jgi:EmrB/QacA subfamily drug resistance transporter
VTAGQAAPRSSTRGTGHHNPYVVLLVVLSATFVQLVDISIVNVAIPSIQRELHASYGAIQLVLVLYQLGFACVLITAGRLGDIYGRKRIFIIGMAGFTIASAICGAAPNEATLVVGRLVQGVFSGLMFPQVLSVIQVTFAPRDRGKAFGILGATIGIATIMGPLLGGLLIQWDPAGLDWRTIFYVNLPIGIAALIGAIRLLGESTAPDAPRLDLPGVAIITVALLALVFPVTEGRDRGWPLWLVALLVASIPLFVLFFFYERRRTKKRKSPLILMSLFRDRSFTVGLVLSFVFFAGVPAFFFSFSIYIQIGEGFSALGSGLTSFPYSIGAAVGSALSDRFTKRLGIGVLRLGLVILVAGMVAMLLTVRAVGNEPHAYQFIPAMVTCGIGLGFFVAPVINIILAGIHTEGAGSASGVLSTFQQVGGAVGVAVIGVIFFGLIGAHAADTADEIAPQLRAELSQAQIPAPAQQSIESGFRACFVDRAKQKDPTILPASCRRAQDIADQAGLPAATKQRMAELVGPDGTITREAIGRDFSRAYKETMLYEIGIFALALLVLLLLPRVNPTQLGHAPPPEASPA